MSPHDALQPTSPPRVPSKQWFTFCYHRLVLFVPEFHISGIRENIFFASDFFPSVHSVSELHLCCWAHQWFVSFQCLGVTIICTCHDFHLIRGFAYYFQLLASMNMSLHIFVWVYIFISLE